MELPGKGDSWENLSLMFTGDRKSQEVMKALL
jgi:hypothetical protein